MNNNKYDVAPDVYMEAKKFKGEWVPSEFTKHKFEWPPDLRYKILRDVCEARLLQDFAQRKIAKAMEELKLVSRASKGNHGIISSKRSLEYMLQDIYIRRRGVYYRQGKYGLQRGEGRPYTVWKRPSGLYAQTSALLYQQWAINHVAQACDLDVSHQ